LLQLTTKLKIKNKHMAFENVVFWKDGFDDGEAQGGIFVRSVDLKKFIEKVEADGTEVVGIKFEDNNLEIITKVK
jgi:hypothetical protein